MARRAVQRRVCGDCGAPLRRLPLGLCLRCLHLNALGRPVPPGVARRARDGTEIGDVLRILAFVLPVGVVTFLLVLWAGIELAFVALAVLLVVALWVFFGTWL